MSATKSDSLFAGLERWILGTDQLMKFVVDIENGPWAAADPVHTHPHAQITYVVEGEILISCDDLKPVRLNSGDLYAIPANRAHCMQLLSQQARIIECQPSWGVSNRVIAPQHPLSS